jgi:hypothetical protein
LNTSRAENSPPGFALGPFNIFFSPDDPILIL